MKLTFFKEWIESDPFQTFTKETDQFLFIRIYEQRIFRNIDVQQWEPRMGRPPFFTVVAARDKLTDIAEYLRKKRKPFVKAD